MECKLSIENDKLLKKLDEEKKQVKYWRKECYHISEINMKWCQNMEKKIDDMEEKYSLHYKSSGELNLENRLLAIFKHYQEILNVKNEKPILGQCEGYCCKQHLSSLWKYCPNCGIRIFRNEDKKKKFKRIIEKLNNHNVNFVITKSNIPIMIYKDIYLTEHILKTSVWNTDTLKDIIEFVEEFNGARLTTVSDQFKKQIESLKKEVV